MNILGLAGGAGAGKDAIADFLVTRYGMIKFAFADALYREVSEAFNISEEYLRDRSNKERSTSMLRLDACVDEDFVKVMTPILQEKLATHYDPEPDVSGWPMSPRMVLQYWGTEYRRAQDPDYWTKRAEMWMEAYTESRKRAVTQEEYDEDIKSIIEDARDNGKEWTETEASQHLHPVGTEYYEDHPGVVVVGVRFENEREWLKDYMAPVWHVDRHETMNVGFGDHASDKRMVPHTGDKMIFNYGTLEQLHTGVALALQGNDIVNTGITED